MKDTRNRSRIEILNYVTVLCTMKYFGENSFSLGNKDNAFHGDHFGPTKIPIGSLVSLQAAPFTKYYLSWLREIKLQPSGFHQYLLESIEDGELCWWYNVSLWGLPLETSNKYPEWHWTDKQWNFRDKWLRTFKRSDDYSRRASYPVFHDDGSVTLSIRTKWSENKVSKTFPNWKKLLTKDMLEFCKETQTIK